MIEKWHERTSGPVFKFVFTLVTLSFVIGGMSANLVGSSNYAAKVNGVEISQEQFQQVKGNRQNELVAQEGEKAWDLLDSPEYAKQFNQSIIDGLVDNELLRQYTNDLKLGVGVDQVKKTIVSNPAFQQDGKFDNNLYLRALANAGLNPDMYAAMIAEGVVFDQIQQGVMGTDFTVPAQQEQLAKLLLQQRQVRIATLSIADEAQKQTASAEELQAYYDAHKSSLIEPEKLTVEYVLLTPEDVKANATVSEAEIEDYYAKNRATFTTRGESQLAHIQVATEAEAQAIEQAVKNGEDFVKLAAEKSTDKLSATKGGDLGWAKAGTFPAAFENAANVLQVGQVSPAIQIDGNYHIIKVLDRKPETVLPLAQVKDEIVKKLSESAQATAYSTAASKLASDAAENSGSLEDVAKNAGLTVHKTAPFTQETVPEVLRQDKVLKALFNSDLRQTGQNSDAFDLSSENALRTLILRVSDYQAERVKTFEEAKAQVENAVKAQKAEHILLAKAEADVKALNAGQAVDLPFQNAKDFIYAQAQLETPVLAKTLFAMPKPAEKATFSQGRNEQGDIVIIALDKVTDGTLAQFQPMVGQFNRAERDLLRVDLLQDLRERASIDVNEEFMESLIQSH